MGRRGWAGTAGIGEGACSGERRRMHGIQNDKIEKSRETEREE